MLMFALRLPSQILWVLYLTSEEDSFFFSVFNMFGDGGLSVSA